MPISHSTTVADNVDTVNASKWNAAHTIPTPYELASTPASFIIYQEAGNIYARNGKTGVNDYGPVAVGSDASGLFQSAINALPSSGGRIFIKAGTYLISTTLSIGISNAQIYGESMFAVILNVAGNINGLNISGGGVIISNLALRTASPQTAGIAVNVTGDFVKLLHINIGTVENRQHFYQGILLSSKYSVLTDLIINNCVNYAIKITGAKNDNRITDLVIDNWGADIFTSNPIGLFLANSNAVYVTHGTIAHCDPGVLFAPATGEASLLIFFSDVDVDTNWGAGIKFAPTGSGIVHNVKFSNIICSTNLQKAAPAEEASVRIQGVKNFQWVGGNIGNNPWEGIIIDTAAVSDVSLTHVSIIDNNQGNHLGALGLFPTAKTPGILINGANVLFQMSMGALDNPGYGASIGNQGGLYVNSADKALFSKVRLLKNVPATGPFGSGVGAGVIFIDDCPGFNPGSYTTTAGASVWTGTNDSPTKEIWVLTTAGGVSAISYRGTSGYPITAKSYPFQLDPGESISVTWATTAPVFTRYPIVSGL